MIHHGGPGEAYQVYEEDELLARAAAELPSPGGEHADRPRSGSRRAPRLLAGVLLAGVAGAVLGLLAVTALRGVAAIGAHGGGPSIAVTRPSPAAVTSGSPRPHVAANPDKVRHAAERISPPSRKVLERPLDRSPRHVRSVGEVPAARHDHLPSGSRHPAASSPEAEFGFER